ncbi:MAG: M3 family oligoendopeptidase, partial [Blautia sp.]|nr:M3 family oligoendopeptidase [Blautia sp.]
IYDNPNLTPKERKQVWKDLERDYKPHLFYDGLEFFENGCFWQKQHHIYSFPLYYIDYVIAQLCAFEYKIWMDKDRKAAWQSYLKLCRMSAAKFHTELLEEAGLETPFKNGVLAKIVENLKK